MKILKFYFWGFVIFGLLILWGDSIEDPPLNPEPWLPPIVQDADKPGYRAKRKNKQSLMKYNQENYTRPWDEDRKEQTEAWADFLEELENRGYDLWDPEAEDIWTEFN